MLTSRARCSEDSNSLALEPGAQELSHCRLTPLPQFRKLSTLNNRGNLLGISHSALTAPGRRELFSVTQIDGRPTEARTPPGLRPPASRLNLAQVTSLGELVVDLLSE